MSIQFRIFKFIHFAILYLDPKYKMDELSNNYNIKFTLAVGYSYKNSKSLDSNCTSNTLFYNI